MGMSELNALYAHTCPVCGGHNTLPVLSDSSLDDLLNNIARELYEKKVSENSIPEALYRHNTDKLFQALTEGLGGDSFDYTDSRNQLGAYLQQNIHAFSAAKSIYQMRHFANMMVREDNTLRSFTEFRNKVLSAGKEFNVNFLQTEYNTAVASAQMAQQWDTLKTLQYLEYSTAGDNRVRAEHKALDKFTAPPTDTIWNTIYPPNAWNCRCTVVPGVAANYGRFTIDKSKSDWAKEEYKIDPYFQRNSGTTKAIFKLDGPVYQIGLKTKSILAVDHYNLPSVQDMLLDHKWNEPEGVASAKEAKKWWQETTGKTGFMDVKDFKGSSLRLTDEFIRHTVDDNNDARWSYIKEAMNVIKDADEIWSNRLDNQLDRIYIKYYDGSPLIVRVNENMQPYTMHNIINKGKLNIAQGIRLRKGALIYKKQ